MRGKVLCASLSVDLLRITPAYAGKRTGKNDGSATNEDHPRVCGEKRRPLLVL